MKMENRLLVASLALRTEMGSEGSACGYPWADGNVLYLH